METVMPVVTVSPKYQIVIPKEIRKSMGIKPGQKIQIFQFGDRLEFVPIKDIRELRGILKGMDTNLERDEEDRI
jgi:AbrB family looped-hinge helix DNA binding protein